MNVSSAKSIFLEPPTIFRAVKNTVVMLHCFSSRLVLRFECSRARCAPRPGHPVATRSRRCHRLPAVPRYLPAKPRGRPSPGEPRPAAARRRQHRRAACSSRQPRRTPRPSRAQRHFYADRVAASTALSAPCRALLCLRLESQINHSVHLD